MGAQEEQALIADLLSSLGETCTEVLESVVQQPETADVTPQAGLEHPGIWGDEGNMRPIRGARYMKQMQLDTFDLCKGCYNALSESDQSEFKVIEPVEPAAAMHVEQAEATLKADEEEAAAALKAEEAAAEFARLAAVEEAKAEACRLAVERVAAKAAAEEAEAARVAAGAEEAARVKEEEAAAAARASKAKAVETAQGPVVPIEWQA